ncbi:MAG: hypothetical protein JXC32_08150 [Anaerolineae bacterium]|nr:hypothetical protein [Anaerolineae bacterium]
MTRKSGLKKLIGELEALEADVRYQELPTHPEDEVGYLKGSVPILISAPHGAKHTRFYEEKSERELKEEDEFTAGLARLVAQKSGAHVIWLRRQSTEDANADRRCRYKTALGEIIRQHAIRFVLDFHGMSADREFGIAIGTANGRSCASETQELVVECLAESGFVKSPTRLSDCKLRRVVINHKSYGANGRNTVTRYVRDMLKAEAVQFEFNAHLRIPQRRADASGKQPFESCNPALIETVVTAMTKVVLALANSLQEG